MKRLFNFGRWGLGRWRLKEPRAGEPRAGQWLSFGLASLSLAVVMTCAGPGRLEPAEPVQPPSEPAESGAREPKQVPPPMKVAVEQNPQAAEQSPSSAALGRAALGNFFVGLQQLEQGEREDHVRVLWLGDSHTAADFWSNTVRRALQARFGVGGPGYVRVGVERYRHGQVKVELGGGWRYSPRLPARTEPLDDGIFGLAGMRASARPGAHATFEPYTGVLDGGARWQVLYRLGRTSSFRATLGDQSVVVGASRPGPTPSDVPIARLALETEAKASLTLDHVRGEPEFFGVIAESREPGLVLDTAGIDGAKARTPLAWNEQAWVSGLQARPPELVILAYGTNEVYERIDPERYIQDYRDLVGRIRQGAPEAACLIVGPTDVARPEGGSQPRVQAISQAQKVAAEELGCAFIDTQRLMGGEGAFMSWAAKRPPWGTSDNVHLTVEGYRELGRRTAELILSEYDQVKAALVTSQQPVASPKPASPKPAR